MDTAESDSSVWCILRSLTPWCDAHHGVGWRSGMIHTGESDSAVGCTIAHRRIFEKFGDLGCASHRGAWLCSGMHTAGLNSAVGCTLQSQTDLKMSVFRFFILATSYDFIFSKNFEVKKIPWTIFNLQYQFGMNIFRHHREVAFVKLRITTDTW